MKALVLIIAALLLAAPASADYRLPHPHHEHCRAHYKRHHNRCVRVKPRTATPVAATPQPATPTPPTPQPAAPEPEPQFDSTGASCDQPSEQAECEAMLRQIEQEVAQEEREEKAGV